MVDINEDNNYGNFNHQVLILTQGLPASGKSTWALEMVKRFPKKVVRVNRDAIRLTLGHKWYRENEKLVAEMRNNMIRTALAAGRSVICDDTNLFDVRWARDMAELYGIPMFVKSFMHVSVEDCIKRDAERSTPVGKDIIERFYYDYWNAQIRLPNEGPRQAIILDIDGTTAHTKIPYPAAYDRDYMMDDVDFAVRDLVNALHSTHGYDIIVVTGRDGKHKAATEAWLKLYGVHYDHIFARPEGDSRDDAIIKSEIYEREIQGKFYIQFVLDDRPRVVRMWRARYGLKVLHVAPNIEF